jgi:hypothetical protein
MKILLGDFSTKVEREDIFKPTIGNESWHEINNDNGFRVVNNSTSKNLVVTSTIFPHHMFINTFGLLLIRKCTHSDLSHSDREETAFKYSWCPFF